MSGREGWSGRAGGERSAPEDRGGERRGAGERWPAASPGRFPGSRRPDRPSRPRPPLRLQPARPSLFAPSPSAPAEAEAESHAPAAPADLIWGRHTALAALEAGRPLHRIWCTTELRFSPRFLQLLREAKASGVLVEEVTWARLGQISGGAVHQGIVLQPAAAATLQLESLIEGCRALGDSPLLIAVDGLTDPQNLGAIVRSAEALGAHGMVLPQRRNAGLTGSVAKVAAGALEHLPVARVVNLNRSLEALKQEGYRVIGLAAEGTVTLEEADLSGPLVLVTGSEAEGLSLLTRRGCDQLVRIPLRGTTPSLNASVATALLLYEVARRSWMAGLRGTAPAPRLERPALPEPEPSAAATPEPTPEHEAADKTVAASAEHTAADQSVADIGEHYAADQAVAVSADHAAADEAVVAAAIHDDADPVAAAPVPAAELAAAVVAAAPPQASSSGQAPADAESALAEPGLESADARGSAAAGGHPVPSPDQDIHTESSGPSDAAASDGAFAEPVSDESQGLPPAAPAAIAATAASTAPHQPAPEDAAAAAGEAPALSGEATPLANQLESGPADQLGPEPAGELEPGVTDPGTDADPVDSSPEAPVEPPLPASWASAPRPGGFDQDVSL